MAKDDLYEVAKIMGVDEETLKVYPKIKFDRNLLNPCGDELLDIFRTLHISPRQTVLDIPCGQGGVSVHLAKEYGVTVDGYDLLQGFIDNANDYAAEHRVQNLCNFFAEDIRAAVDKGKEFDLVIWSAAPHLWENYRQTIGNLRKCAKPGGTIVIADAYVYTDECKAAEPDYETLEEILQSVTAYGDTVLKYADYAGTLWAENYRTDREAVIQAVNNADTQTEKEILKQYLKTIGESEQSDTACLGLFIVVLQVVK